MAFIDDLFEGGGYYIIERTEGGATLRPASDKPSDLQAFQNAVARVRRNEGDGYAIHLDHVCSDQPGNLVDLLILTIDG